MPTWEASTVAPGKPVLPSPEGDGFAMRSKADAGMTVLIHGVAGGVGSFASQTAKTFGAKVSATATAKTFDISSR